jgi:hypothetical protein
MEVTCISCLFTLPATAWTDNRPLLDCDDLWIDRGKHRNLAPKCLLWQGRERKVRPLILLLIHLPPGLSTQSYDLARCVPRGLLPAPSQCLPKASYNVPSANHALSRQKVLCPVSPGSWRPIRQKLRVRSLGQKQST